MRTNWEGRIGNFRTMKSKYARKSVASLFTILLVVSYTNCGKFKVYDADSQSSHEPPAPFASPLYYAQKYFPSPETEAPKKRIFRLTREQIDQTTKSLLPQFFTESVRTAMGPDSLQTNYEFAESIGIHSANFTPLSNWIETLTERIKSNPRAVIDCPVSNPTPICLRTQARAFLVKAFRGDIEEAKLMEFSDFLVTGVQAVGMAEATADFANVVLSSPQYLFRREMGNTGDASLSPPETLQTITYVLADAPADALGLSSQNAGQHIASETALQTTAEGIISNQLTREKLMRFFIAWLEVKEPDEFTISPAVFPEFTEELAEAMVLETRRFLTHHLTKAAPTLKDITQSTQSFVSDALESIYDVNAADPNGNALVDLNKNERLGIFSQGAVIASHSGPTTTRLIKRGTFFARKVMCMEIGATPPGVDTTLPMGNDMTERQKVESITNQPRCLGCHRIINPLGFFQENFGPLGNWRTSDNSFPIDASVTFDNLDERTISANGPVETLRYFTNSYMFKQCFVRQMFRFYMGRNEVPSDDPLLRQMFLTFVDGDRQNILELLKILATAERVTRK